MKRFTGRTAVITGAASGFGLESSRIAAREGMNVVMADVQADALDKAAAEIGAGGAPVLACRLDVSKATEVEALGAAALGCEPLCAWPNEAACPGCGGPMRGVIRP